MQSVYAQVLAVNQQHVRSSADTRTFRVCIFSVRRRNATYGLFVVEPSRFSVRTCGIRACCCTPISKR